MTADGVGRFEALYIQWRFGDLAARLAAIAEGKALLASARPDKASIHLKLALLMKADNPQMAEGHLAAARDLGAAIPRSLARVDEAGAPDDDQPGTKPVLDRRIVQAASTRTFSQPEGERWHPAFDLAATELPPLELSVIADGTLSIDTTGGRLQVYVFDSHNRLVRDLSTGPAPFIVDPAAHAGPLVLLDDVFDGFNICHALFDKFPRLSHYEARFPQERLAALMLRDHAYYREALAELGHQLIHPTAGRWSIQAGRLALLSNHRRGEVMHPGWSGAGWTVDFISQRLQSPTPGHRRIYISREDAAVRRTVNETEVQACFRAHGFEVLELTGLRFGTQKILFQQASHIAGTHGAGLANLAFAHPSTRVLEIMPPLAGTFAYWVMAGRLGMRYHLLTAQDAVLPVGTAASYDPMLGDRPIRVDVARLDETLVRFVG